MSTQSDAVYGTSCPSLPSIASTRKQFYLDKAGDRTLSLLARRHFARLAEKCSEYDLKRSSE